MAKEFLSRQGIPFEAKNIVDPGVQDELERRGFRSAPVVFIDGIGYPGFDPGKLSELLKLADARYATTALNSDLAQRYDEVLAAWVRAVRQIPRGRLDMPVNMNAPTHLARLLYQVPHLETTMAARDTGVWDASGLAVAIPDDPEVIASELSDLRQRFALWASSLTPDDLDRVCSGFYGEVGLSRLIEHSLGRAAFHLRRVYAIMREELRIEPDAPLADARLDEIALPERMLAG